jgi:putative intracellular protease/amidase
MKEVLFMLVDEYADWEAALIAAALNDSDGEHRKYCVKTVSVYGNPVRSIGGFTVIPDYSLESAPEDFAALLLIGARSWKNDSSKPVAALLKKAVKKGVIVGGICGGTAFLAMHGVLNGVSHTSNSLDYLKEAAKERYTGEKLYVSEQAVSDGGIITANGTAHMEFTKEVLIALDAKPQRDIDAWYDYFKLGFYEAEKKWGVDSQA